jgi:hypothetical protein
MICTQAFSTIEGLTDPSREDGADRRHYDSCSRVEPPQPEADAQSSEERAALLGNAFDGLSLSLG